MTYDDYLQQNRAAKCKSCGQYDWSVNDSKHDLCDDCQGERHYENYRETKK